MESSIMNRSTIYGIVKDSLLRQARPELNQFEILLYQTSPFYKQQYDAAAYNFLMHKTNRIKLGRTAMITKAHPDVREDIKQVLAEVNAKINTSGARVGIMLGPDFSELVLESVAGQEGLFDWIKNKFKGQDNVKLYQRPAVEMQRWVGDPRQAVFKAGKEIHFFEYYVKNTPHMLMSDLSTDMGFQFNLDTKIASGKNISPTMPVYVCKYRAQKDIDYRITKVSAVNDSFDVEAIKDIQPISVTKTTLGEICKQCGFTLKVSSAAETSRRKQIASKVFAVAKAILTKHKTSPFIKTLSLYKQDYEYDEYISGSSDEIYVLNATLDRGTIPYNDDTDNDQMFDDAWKFVDQVFAEIQAASRSLPGKWEMDADKDGAFITFILKS